MGHLPLYIVLDHLPEIAGRNRVVVVRPALGFVECFARNRHAETAVKRGEPVLPMEAVAVEGAAHVEKDRANHSAGSLLDDWLARKRRSPLRCQSERPAKAMFIGTRMNPKNKSIRWSRARTPMTKKRVLSPRKFQPRTSG